MNDAERLQLAEAHARATWAQDYSKEGGVGDQRLDHLTEQVGALTAKIDALTAQVAKLAGGK